MESRVFFKHIVNLEALFGTFTFTVFLRIINLQQVFHPLSLLVQKFTFLYSFVVAFLGDPFVAIIFGQSVLAKSCRMCFTSNPGVQIPVEVLWLSVNSIKHYSR